MGIPGITDRIRIRDRRVEVRGGGGCLCMIGLVFLGFGCVPAVAILGRWWVLKETVEFCVVPIHTLFFIGLGAFLFFARYRVDLDGEARTYRKRLFFFRAGKGTSGSLDRFDTVVVVRCERHGASVDDPGTTEYPISLTGRRGSLRVWQETDPDRARNRAEQIAKALGFSLLDGTEPGGIVREPGHLDESLRQRRLRTGEAAADMPTRPRQMKTRVHQEGRELVLEIPPFGWPPTSHIIAGVVFGGMFLAFVSGIGWPALSDLRRTRDPISCVLGILFCCAAALIALLPLTLHACWILGSRYRRYTVRATPEHIEVTTHGVLRTRIAGIPADELEELHLDWSVDERIPDARIKARSDRTVIRFGGRLSKKEAEWIKSALEHILTQ